MRSADALKAVENLMSAGHDASLDDRVEDLGSQATTRGGIKSSASLGDDAVKQVQSLNGAAVLRAGALKVELVLRRRTGSVSGQGWKRERTLWTSIIAMSRLPLSTRARLSAENQVP
jgi:hypothetical protein